MRLLNDLPLAFDRACADRDAEASAEERIKRITELAQWITEFATEGEHKGPSEFLNVWWLDD